MERVRRSALGLSALALFLLAALSAPAPVQGQPTLGWACDADNDCTGVDEACVLGRCLSLRCNADSECLVRMPFCRDGTCQDSNCSDDDDCVGDCVDGRCEEVECSDDRPCSTGTCIDNSCRDCARDADCGANGVCRQNSCVCVECARNEQCAFDETCSREQNRCVPFCPPGRVLVSATDNNRVCKTCVDPDSHRRCNEFPGCRGNTICAQGFCINRCSIDPPDFDSIGGELPTRWRYQPDPDGNPPDCPRCTARLDLAALRTTLERVGFNQPVTVRILQPSGEPLAEIGSFKPNKGSWAAIPLRAQPSLAADLGAGGCGYTLEISNDGGAAKKVLARICLQPTK